MSRVIKDLRDELKIIVKGVKKVRLPENEYFKTLEHEGKLLSYPKEIQWSYYRVILLLREKSINLGKVLSDGEIENILDDFLMEIVYDDPIKRMRTVEREIKQLFNSIKSLGTENHLFIIPINNLTISDDLKIGDSEIFTLDETSLTKIIEQYSLDFSVILRDARKKAEDMNVTNETSTYARVTVDAQDDEKAEELALLKTEGCLNVIRLFYYRSPFTIRDEKIDHFVRDIMHVNLSHNRYSESMRAINLETVIHAPNIDSAAINKMDKQGLSTINNLLLKEEEDLTSLGGDVLTAIFWFGSAVKEKDRKMKFVKFMTSLETILIPDGGVTKQHRLATRFTSILYSKESPEEKKKVYHLMKNLYKLRSLILHSGKGYIFNDDLAQATIWSRQVIFQILKEVNDYQDVIELIGRKYPIDEELYRPNWLANFLLLISRKLINLAHKMS